jgi:hypothetical protein
MENKQTAVQQMITEFTDIQRNKCKALQEVLFFDGVLAIIEAKYLPLEREQIEEAFEKGWVERKFYSEMTSGEYYTQTFNP